MNNIFGRLLLKKNFLYELVYRQYFVDINKVVIIVGVS